jgi:hypothetical protein
MRRQACISALEAAGRREDHDNWFWGEQKTTAVPVSGQGGGGDRRGVAPAGGVGLIASCGWYPSVPEPSDTVGNHVP